MRQTYEAMRLPASATIYDVTKASLRAMGAPWQRKAITKEAKRHFVRGMLQHHRNAQKRYALVLQYTFKTDNENNNFSY